MATGEVGWSSKGKAAVKYDRTPVPRGEYELKILGNTWEVKKKNEPGSLPYLNGRFEVLGTNSTDGGKNRQVFHRIWLGLYKEKDGVKPLERANSLNGIAKGLGEDVDITSVLNAPKKDKKSGGLTKVPIADPKEVLAWLKDHDGAILKGFIKVKKQKDFDDSNEIEYFVEAEAGVEVEDEEVSEELELDNSEAASEESVEETTEETVEESEEVSEETEEITEEPEEEVEEDMTETFNPKAKAAAAAAKAKAQPKPGPKVKQGPVKKGKK